MLPKSRRAEKSFGGETLPGLLLVDVNRGREEEKLGERLMGTYMLDEVNWLAPNEPDLSSSAILSGSYSRWSLGKNLPKPQERRILR